MAKLKLKYGTYEHSEGEVSAQIVRQAVLGQVGYRTHRRERWTVTGVLIAASQSALQTEMDSLKAAYDQDGRDLTFLFDDDTETHHKIVNSDTLNGVRIRMFQWLDGLPGQWGAHTEYTLMRSFRFMAEAEILDQEESDLFYWNEVIEQIGNGGPDFAVQENLTGIPIRQETKNFTAGRAVQRGTAMGFTSYPSLPAVLFPGLLKPHSARPSYETPKQFGRQRHTLYPIHWNYQYLAPTAIPSGPPPLPAP